MNTLFVKGSRFEYNNSLYELDDMFSTELFERLNMIVDDYESNLCITNEVFLNRVQPYKAMELFLANSDIENIKLEKPDEGLTPLVLDYAKKRSIKVVGAPFLYKSRKMLHGYFNIVITALYLIWKMILIPQKADLHSTKEKISLIRTPASKKKLSFLKDVDLRYEDFRDKTSIYSCFKKREKVFWVIKAWMDSYSEILNFVSYIDKVLGPYSSYNAFEYYSKRIVHTLLYAIVLEKFLSNNKGRKFYTGNNLDRYALIEERIAKQNNIEIISIPHGLEYGFKFPHCFIGDIFFTTSLNAAMHFNNLYETNKFIYNQEIANMMFSVKIEKKKGGKNIVFFTEPRESEVNFKIIEELFPLFKGKGLDLFIKLHPKDRTSDYDKYLENIKFLDDFNSSVTNNICIARKSTTLLEAVYNHSDAAAIIINSKDKVIFNTFPSLQDEKIKVFYSIKELFEWILEKMNYKKA